MTKRQYFGTDGIRGRVGEAVINPEFVTKLGWAAGQQLTRAGTSRVLIGKDTRISGYMLESALEAGLSAAGIDIGLLGPMPTPAIAYLTKTFRSEAGIVISASHNPYYDNGIKFFSADGYKLPDDIELAIEQKLTEPMTCVPSSELGKASRILDAGGRYIEYCKGTFPSSLSLKGLKIVVDCANGATYHIAPNVLRELGADVITIGTDPDGVNINEKVGATAIRATVEAVKLHQADAGFALDGDGDRIMMVDEKGQVVDGDQIIFIIARDMLRRGQLSGGVVGTQMSNFGLERAFDDLGIPFIRSKVGDRYVLEKLREKRWVLGGENSGHVLDLRSSTTGDGIVGGLQVLAAMVKTEKSLSSLCAGFAKYPQKLINVKCQHQMSADPLESERVKNTVALIESQLRGGGRVLLRKSGTEPLVRVMVEAEDAALATQCAQQIADVVEQVCA